MLGLIPLSAGEIEVLGQPARRGNAAIGYVPQRRHFDAEIRVRGRDIVRLGLDGNRWGLPLPFCGASARARGGGAGARGDRAGGRGGVRGSPDWRAFGRGAAAAADRAGAGDEPRMLALDEPLDSLDLRNQQGVAGMIRQICRETGAAVLLVAHDINPILAALDRVVYVAHGKVAVGTPEEVITTETLSRLYNTPIEVLRASDGRLVVVGQAEEEVSYHAHHRSVTRCPSWDLVADVQRLLHYDFMRNAYLAGTLVALVAGIVGYFMVLRSQSFAGHSLANVGFAGATGAALIGVPAVAGLFVAGVLAAIGIQALNVGARQTRQSDIAVGAVLRRRWRWATSSCI